MPKSQQKVSKWRFVHCWFSWKFSVSFYLLRLLVTFAMNYYFLYCIKWHYIHNRCSTGITLLWAIWSYASSNIIQKNRRSRALYNMLVLPHLEYAGAYPAVGDEARFPPAAIWGTTTSAGSALLTQASPPWRPHSCMQNVFLRVGSWPQSLFYSASAAWLERSCF